MSKSKNSPGRERAEELNANLARIADEIQPLTASVENLYQLLQWVVQNREEMFDLLAGKERVAETIQCQESCDNSCDSLAEAVQAGWLDITFDPKGRSWNYLGWCPDCIAKHNDEERKLNEPKPETKSSTLFPLDNDQ